MKTTLMTILLGWMLIIHMETGEILTIGPLRSKENCEANGYANGATKSDLSLRTFECIEKK